MGVDWDDDYTVILLLYSVSASYPGVHGHCVVREEGREGGRGEEN